MLSKNLDFVPKKSRKRKQEFLVYDIETKKGTWTDFYFVGLYDGKEYNKFFSVEDFLNYVLVPENNRKIFYAHFSDFDSLFLLNVLKDTDLKVVTLSEHLLIQFVVSDKRNKWFFRNSYVILPDKLKKLFETYLTEEKKESLDDIFKRNMSDCTGLYKILLRYYKDNEGNLGLTTASTKMKVYQTKFLKKSIEDNKKLNNVIRKAYYGGRTEIFKYNTDLYKHFYLYDVVSLYPSVMKENPYPIGKLKRFSSIEGIEGIALAKIRKDNNLIPYLPERISKKMFFLDKKKYGWYSIAELKYMKEIGADVEIQKIFGTPKIEYIFDEYVDYYFKLKNEAKKNNNKILYQDAKLSLNSLYGKFGQKERKELFIMNELLMNELYPDILVNGVNIIKKQYDTFYSFIKPLLSCYVTAFAKIKMHEKYLTKVDYEIIYYTDTDSLALSEQAFKSSSKLGELELKEKLNNFILIAPKFYITDNEIKCKGISKKEDENNTEEENETEFNKNIYDYLSGKQVTMKGGLEKFRTAIKKPNWLNEKEQKRTFKAVYDKREIQNDYSTIPIKNFPYDNSKIWRELLNKLKSNYEELKINASSPLLSHIGNSDLTC